MIRTVKVTRNVIDGEPWRIETENGEINEPISPDTLIWEIDTLNGSRVYLRDWVGSRPSVYLKAERSVDGWQKFRRYRGKPIHW